MYDADTPDRWHNVARYMGGGTSVEEVRRHYQQLVVDVALIESVHWYAADPPPSKLHRGMHVLRVRLDPKNFGFWLTVAFRLYLIISV